MRTLGAPNAITPTGLLWRKAGLHAFVALVALVVGAGVMLFVAMSLLMPKSPWSNDPGRALAMRLQAANSPLVREIVFRPQTFIDPPEVDVWLRPGATEAQASALWCEVIAPAGGSPFEGDLGVVVWNDAGTEMMAVNPPCPAT
jgi:hypothetical protein